MIKHLTNNRYQIILLILAVFLAYINVYQNDFLIDDIDGIVQNKNLDNLGLSLASHSPVNILNTLTYKFAGGTSKEAFHLGNVLIHVINVLLVYILLNVLSAKRLAFPAALIFAIHPINTESVTWISARPYSLYTLFVLVSLIAFILYTHKPSIKIISLSAASFLLAIFTSEKAIILPLILALYLFLFKKIKPFLPALFIVSVTSLPYLIGLTLRLNSRIASLNIILSEQIAQFNSVTQIPTAISSYIELFILPINLTVYHAYLLNSPLELLLKLSVTASFFTALIISFNKNKMVFFALSIFIISLLPTFLPIAVGWVVAERYIYLGSIGLSITMAFLITKIGELTKSKETPFIIYFLIIFIYLITTFGRNSEWKSFDDFWPATVTKSYYFPGAHINMGNYYTKHDQYDQAINEFNLALSLKDGKFPIATYNLGNVYLITGNTDKAIESFNKTVLHDPNYLDAYYKLIQIYLDNKDLDLVEKLSNTVIKINPNSAKAYNFLGIINIDRKDFKQAKKYFEKALSLDPNNIGYQNNVKKVNTEL